MTVAKSHNPLRNQPSPSPQIRAWSRKSMTTKIHPLNSIIQQFQNRTTQTHRCTHSTLTEPNLPRSIGHRTCQQVAGDSVATFLVNWVKILRDGDIFNNKIENFVKCVEKLQILIENLFFIEKSSEYSNRHCNWYQPVSTVCVSVVSSMNLIYWQSLRTMFVSVCVCSCVDEADNDLYWSVVAACGSDSFSHKTNITHAMQTPAHTNTRSSQTNMALGPWITDINLDGGRFRAVLQIYSFNHLWDRFCQHVRCCDIFLPKINKYFLCN